MSNLNQVYDTVKCTKKLPFDIDGITDALMAEPLNLDIGEILHTPSTVIVKRPKDEYIKQKIVGTITRMYSAKVNCRSDYLVFMAAKGN